MENDPWNKEIPQQRKGSRWRILEQVWPGSSFFNLLLRGGSRGSATRRTKM